MPFYINKDKTIIRNAAGPYYWDYKREHSVFNELLDVYYRKEHSSGCCSNPIEGFEILDTTTFSILDNGTILRRLK